MIDTLIKVRVPLDLEIRMERLHAEPGEVWLVRAVANVINVEEPHNPIEVTTRCKWGETPDKEVMLRVAMDLLEHEMREQLGMDPHGRQALAEQQAALNKKNGESSG